jgi:hypothetical protein
MNCNFNKNIVLYSDVAALLARIAELEKIRFELEQDANRFPTMAEFSNLQDDNAKLQDIQRENKELKERLAGGH